MLNPCTESYKDVHDSVERRKFDKNKKKPNYVPIYLFI